MAENILEELERKIEEVSSLIKTMRSRQALFETYIRDHNLEQDYLHFCKEMEEKRLKLEDNRHKKIVKTPRI